MAAVIEARPSSAIVGKHQPKRMMIILAACLLSPASAWTQTRSGTIVVIGYSKQKIILAADSRANLGNGRYEDSYCKITALSDKLLFAATGIVGEHSYLLPEDLRFGATDEARKAVARTVAHPDQSSIQSMGLVGEVAHQWAEAMAYRFKQASPVRLAEWLRIVSHNRERAFVIGIFAGLESNGEINVGVAHVDYGEPREGFTVPLARYNLQSPVMATLPEGRTIFEPYGMPDIVFEMKLGQTQRARQEAIATSRLASRLSRDQFDRALAIRYVDLTIAYHPGREFVGGPIDAAEMMRGGKIGWIQRKDNCPER